jgi:hypothetical protein
MHKQQTNQKAWGHPLPTPTKGFYLVKKISNKKCMLNKYQQTQPHTPVYTQPEQVNCGPQDSKSIPGRIRM